MSNNDCIEIARGLTYCAHDAYGALKLIIENPNTSLSIGILAGHVIETSLKAHLALAGLNELQLKALGHNLLKCWDKASTTTLNLSKPYPKWLIGINYSHKNMRFRYPKGNDSAPWLPHPNEYMDELAYILEPLINDFMYENGKYANEF